MQTISDAHIDEFKRFVDSHEFFFVAGHKEPDGDCVYSCLGMAEILQKLGAPCQLLSAGPFKRSDIRDKAELFTSVPVFLSEPEREQTGLIILDCSEMARLGDIDGDLQNLDTFIIDHHKTASAAENRIIDPTSPATACLVQQLHERLVGDLSEEAAKNLFFALSADTGFFRFLGEDSAPVFEQAARLVRAGASPRRTYDKMTGGKSFNTRKLLGLLLSRAEQHYNNKLVVTYETMEDTKKYGQEGRDSDALYSALLSTENVEAVLFVRQDTEFSCSVGFRSRDAVDVSAIAAKFGGGGHKNAAGLSVKGKIENVMPMICKEFAKVL